MTPYSAPYKASSIVFLANHWTYAETPKIRIVITLFSTTLKKNVTTKSGEMKTYGTAPYAVKVASGVSATS
ncbi:MAG: hypothetical protein ACJA2B_000527 [Candidatus Endobugula sp.]|jgi:hypothetical protein